MCVYVFLVLFLEVFVPYMKAKFCMWWDIHRWNLDIRWGLHVP